jgi:rod shape-determining protein MreB
MFIRKLGIDLGTANTLVFVPGKGVVIQEPSVVAVARPENRVLAIGVEAKQMLGRTPDVITTHRPLREGVIADYRVTQAMLRYFINKACGPWKVLRPDVIVSSPAGSTSTERKAVIDAAREAGARNAFVVKEPILAAIGAGIPINSASGNMVVNIGGGTTEVAVISLGGIVAWASVRVAGDRMDQAITEYLKRKHNLAVGEQTAEEVKMGVGSALPLPEKEKLEMEIRGQDLVDGLPRTIVVTSNDVAEAIQAPLKEIVQTVKTVLRETPAELAADVMDRGMILTGGGAMLRNIDELLLRATGVPAYVADEPFFAVAKGTGIVLENLEVYKRAVQAHR